MSSAPLPFLFVNPRSLPSMNSSNLNVHHLSDVVVGTAVGLIAAAFKKEEGRTPLTSAELDYPILIQSSFCLLPFYFCLFLDVLRAAPFLVRQSPEFAFDEFVESQCAPPVRRGCGNRCRAHHGGFCLETFRKRQKAKRKKEERRSPVPSRTIRSLFSLHFAFCLFTFAFPRCPPRRRLSCSLIRGVYLR